MNHIDTDPKIDSESHALDRFGERLAPPVQLALAASVDAPQLGDASEAGEALDARGSYTPRWLRPKQLRQVAWWAGAGTHNMATDLASRSADERWHSSGDSRSTPHRQPGCPGLVCRRARGFATPGCPRVCPRLNCGRTVLLFSAHVNCPCEKREVLDFPSSGHHDVSAVPLQQSLRHLDSAFTNFFEHRAHHPRFKRKRDRQSATFLRAAFHWDGEILLLAKMDEPLDIRWTKRSKARGGGPYRFAGVPSSVTVSRDPSGRWFVSFTVVEEIAPLPNHQRATEGYRGIGRAQRSLRRTRARQPRPRERMIIFVPSRVDQPAEPVPDRVDGGPARVVGRPALCGRRLVLFGIDCPAIGGGQMSPCRRASAGTLTGGGAAP